tara:strand:- start:998 stop:3043 length:2046 start_codon:yes stop_codon:yes gene_type:complete
VNNLVKEITKGLLEEEKRTVAVYGGGFKPPTAGHFEVVETALKKNPNIDKFIILIGGKGRDGVTSEESLIIWDIYKQYLPINVEVKLSPKPPIQAVYNYAKEHPDEDVIFVIGAREGNEDDFKDIANRTTSVDKYPNLRVSTIVTQGGASGTAARNAAKISAEKLRPLLPKQLKDEEVEEIFSYINDTVMERKILKEVLDSTKFDFKPLIKSLTSSMEADGLNLKPYPKIIFKHDEEANAEDFFGKTAYYDPNNNEVVLYTLGRHPKDIMRSYAHELIHVHQNHEDRLEGINTDDVNEDDYLEKIEREAYEKGNIAFRSWTNKDPFGLREHILKLAEEVDLENVPEKSVDLKTYGDLKLALKNIKKDQNLKKFKDVGGKAFSAALNLLPGVGTAIDAYGVFKAAFNKPDNVKTNTWLDKLDVDDDASKIVDDTVENEFLKVAADKFMSEPDDRVLDPNFNMDDELNNHLKGKFNARHVGGVSEAVVGKRIVCDNCNWAWDIKDGGDDLYMCHKCGHDNENINEQEEKVNYKIYCDMDGVLADFESGYEKLTGIDLKGEFQKGSDFWDPISKAGVGFWAGLKWMPGGQKLWDYIKPYNPDLLSAPSREESSRIGKAVWVKHKLPGTKLILRYAKQKQELANPESILIDDRQINIDQWEAAGGIGILHTSTDNTISQLKELGL